VHPKTSSYFWEYRGGCYGSGDIGVYEKAIPGNEYRFDNIPIEVREDEGLSVFAGNVGSRVGSVTSPLFMRLSTLCLIGSILSALAFVFLYARHTKLI
jgi:hypothetical protein